MLLVLVLHVGSSISNQKKKTSLVVGPVLAQAADLAAFFEAVNSVEVGCMLLMCLDVPLCCPHP